MWLILEHPELANRDCNQCTIFQYDDKGKRVKRRSTGRDLRRPRGIGPPCRYGKCEKGTAENQKVLTAYNRAAYQHYLECRATASFPDDPIVKRNAGLIRSVEDQHRNGFALKTLLVGMTAGK